MEGQARILIVDDEPHFRFAVGIALRTAGCDVSEAEDGLTGVSLVEEAAGAGKAFDLLLVDLDIPRMSGLEVIDHIRARGISVPVFVVTGFAERTVVDALRARDGVDVLFKPFGPRDLIERIGELVGRRKPGD